MVLYCMMRRSDCTVVATPVRWNAGIDTMTTTRYSRLNVEALDDTYKTFVTAMDRLSRLIAIGIRESVETRLVGGKFHRNHPNHQVRYRKRNGKYLFQRQQDGGVVL